MAAASIPVDLFNPGQVFASLGFLEAADALLGNAEANFEWTDPRSRFVLSADSSENPFECVLRFLAEASIVEMTPVGYVEGGAAEGEDNQADNPDGATTDGDENADGPENDEDEVALAAGRVSSSAFPCRKGDRNSLPIRLEGVNGEVIVVSHWTDGSSRNPFKLYSGNRSAHRIATQMLRGSREKPKKRRAIGDLKARGLAHLWQEKPDALIAEPFNIVTPMGGSFNFDPRGAWTAIDAGYSPNTQKDSVAASPVVEILAAIGLEHARPDESEPRRVRYAVWGQSLPPMLARAALAGGNLNVSRRCFQFELDLSGKNKVMTFAREETRQ